MRTTTIRPVLLPSPARHAVAPTWSQAATPDQAIVRGVVAGGATPAPVPMIRTEAPAQHEYPVDIVMSVGFLARESPRLPPRRWTVNATMVAIAGVIHVLGVTLLFMAASGREIPPDAALTAPEVMRVILPSLMFRPSESVGGGGGGGGNRQNGPIRHAQGVGRDTVTLRTTQKPPTADRVIDDSTPFLLLLDARPLASGAVDQIGLPVGGVSYGTSTGPGSGGGVGTGVGTGIGSGRGHGIGAGSGGGAGGSVYRPGGAVTAPRLISQTKPRYTPDALLAKIQGSVWLELVVTRDGRVDHVRVTRSLDTGGLDQEAISAVRSWRFEPGRLGDAPVDVRVTVVMDFTIR
ncbi:MAG: energy transducer TonB [Acidobacteriota bacterium]